MKKTMLLLLVLAASASLHAQLSKTKWKTPIQMDNNPVDVIFDFGKDSLAVYTVAENNGLETMAYSDQDKVLTIKKAYGQSNCDTEATGKYKYEIKNDEMILTLVSDDCADRSSVLNGAKLVRVKP